MDTTAISSCATVRPFGHLVPRVGDRVVIMAGVRVVGDVTLANYFDQ